MTLKFHFLWSTLFWLEESVSAIYSDWLRGKSETNSCSWSVKTTSGITPSNLYSRAMVQITPGQINYNQLASILDLPIYFYILADTRIVVTWLPAAGCWLLAGQVQQNATSVVFVEYFFIFSLITAKAQPKWGHFFKKMSLGQEKQEIEELFLR